MSVKIETLEIAKISSILDSTTSIGFSSQQEGHQQLLTGIILYATGQFDTADQVLDPITSIEDYQNTIGYWLTSGDLYLLKGNLSLLKGDYEQAIEYYEDAVYSPIGIFTGANLVWLYFQTDRTEEAFDLLNQAIGNTVQYAWADGIYPLSIRAQLYALAFDYDSAIADMDAAIELAEENNISDERLARLYTLRGEIILLIYEWDRALENFDTAIELAPDYPPAHYQRGILLYTMADRERALESFQRYLELAPDGEFIELATAYMESIQTELDALGG